MSLRVKVGCDPEFFLINKKTMARVSAHDIVPGTKAAPHKLDKGAVQADGTAVEINIDPASSADEFEDNLHTVLDQVRKIVPSEFSFDYTPTIQYPARYWEGLPDSAKVNGCDPDYFAAGITWTPTIRPINMRNGAQCFGGGHLHVSWTKDADVDDKNHLFDCTVVVDSLERWYSTAHFIWDTDYKRGFEYGGRVFRPKPYGVEYRSPSNAWLRYPLLWPWIFESVDRVLDCVAKNRKRDGFEYYYHSSRIARANKSFATYFGKDFPELTEKMIEYTGT